MYSQYLLSVPSVRIALPDRTFLGVQAAGNTRNRPPGDAQEDWPGAGVVVSGAAQVDCCGFRDGYWTVIGSIPLPYSIYS